MSLPLRSEAHHYNYTYIYLDWTSSLNFFLFCLSLSEPMRAEDNPLDLNNLPDDFSRDGNRSTLELGSSSTGGCSKKKKRGGKDIEGEKVYECRFCSLKFCKSQALGGHMNRHRQERETEAMNKARQMVFGDSLAAPQTQLPHLGCQSVGGANYHHHQYHPCPSTDPQLPSFRSVYPSPPAGTTRLYPTAMSALQPPHQLYPSQSGRLVSGYYMSHVLSSGGPLPESNYTCIGAPVQDHHHHI